MTSSAEAEADAEAERLAAKARSAGSGGGTALLGVLAAAAALGAALWVGKGAARPTCGPPEIGRRLASGPRRLRVRPCALLAGHVDGATRKPSLHRPLSLHDAWHCATRRSRVCTQVSGADGGLTGLADKTASPAAPVPKARAWSKVAAEKAAAEAAALEAAAAEVAAAKAAAERVAYLRSPAGKQEARTQANALAAAKSAQQRAAAATAREEKAAAAKAAREAAGTREALAAPKDYSAGKVVGGGGGAVLSGLAVVGGGGLAAATAARARWVSASKVGVDRGRQMA